MTQIKPIQIVVFEGETLKTRIILKKKIVISKKLMYNANAKILHWGPNATYIFH